MARRAKVWHLEDIKAALRKRYGTLRRLSVAWGYHHGAITKVLTDPRYSEVLERRIASALHAKPHVLWPDRWDADGISLPRAGDHRDITAISRKSCLKEEAA